MRPRIALPEEVDSAPRGGPLYHYGLTFREAEKTDWPSGFKWTRVERGRLSADRDRPEYTELRVSPIFSFGLISSETRLSEEDCLRLGVAKWTLK